MDSHDSLFRCFFKGGCLRWLWDTNHVLIYIHLHMSSSYVSMYYIFTRVILQTDHGNVYIQMFSGAAGLQQSQRMLKFQLGATREGGRFPKKTIFMFALRLEIYENMCIYI